MIHQITAIDVLISLFYIIVIIFIAVFSRPSKEKEYCKFYFPFVLSKIFFSIIFVLIHSYYYKGGDTFLYFSGGKFFFDQFIANPSNSLNLLFSSFESIQNIAVTDSSGILYALRSNDVYFMSKIIGILNLFTAGNFLASSIVFTLITAIGIWQMYKTFCELYPPIYTYLAIGMLFYPSLGIWSSGILKDPLTFAAVGFLFRGAFNILKFRNIIPSIIAISISIGTCFILKPYILYTFIPILLFWVQGSFIWKTKSAFLRFLITPIVLTAFIAGGYLVITQISSAAGKYSLENVQSVAEGFQSWHTYLAETRDQSGYSLGEVEFTALGVLRKSPEALFVTYFRPFIIGDVRNVATLFEALQSLILLLLSIFVFFKVGILNSLKLIIMNRDIRAFMLFAGIFGVTVGLTSYNFGALSRYKIPSVPFFIASLAIIYYLGYLKPKQLKQII
tara:strand:- start:31528 stop:32871 length:1344 start_codon:yes stop_codon:yes gene_type:complete